MKREEKKGLPFFGIPKLAPGMFVESSGRKGELVGYTVVMC